MAVRFVVREPVPVNQTYGRRGHAGVGFDGGVGLFKRPQAERFRAAVGDAALAARTMTPAWPSDPMRVARARISYQLYDFAGDTDSVRKPLRDAIQQILIDNDRDMEDGPATFPIRDGLGRRVDVFVELLAMRSRSARQSPCRTNSRRWCVTGSSRPRVRTQIADIASRNRSGLHPHRASSTFYAVAADRPARFGRGRSVNVE
jgi:hypothetical protein